MRIWMAVGLLAAGSVSVGTASPAAESTITGWVACDRCSPARLKAERLRPVNRDCAQRCITDGAATTLIDEPGRRLLRVTNPEVVDGQEGHYLRLTGDIDDEAETITITSVEVLEEYVAFCARLPPERR